ncbi:hypothetical protein H0H87_004487, partial [Tephrocybe sp. NHM501043]
GPKKKGKSSEKGKEKETVANAKSKDDEEQEAWMAIAECNIEDFIEEGLNEDIFAGLTDNDTDGEVSSTVTSLSDSDLDDFFKSSSISSESSIDWLSNSHDSMPGL